MTAVDAARQGCRQWRGVVEEYRAWLPVLGDASVVSLGEGGTPLVRSQWLSEVVHGEVWLKVEGDNPTGSFKDRGMTVAISAACGEGAEAVVCASTGNTSASMSAYAARAGLTPLVLVPHGRIAAGKLAQAVMHGASVIQVRGNFDDCLRLARELADSFPVSLVNSVNPMRLEGQKTAAFEVVDALGRVPDVHVLPVGNAGNVSAYWLGYCEYAAAGRTDCCPRMWGFQAAGAAPLVSGRPVAQPDTVATAIRVGNPASWSRAVAARDESGGRFDSVTDEQIIVAQRELAARDGVFVEPASAAGAAGLVLLAGRGDVDPGQQVVVTVTGHGLKDTDTVRSCRELFDRVVDPDLSAAAVAAGLR
ncbi:threonine synthase [soil metagenome]